MDIIGYMITLVNLQNMSRVGPPLKDISLHVGTLYELTRELVSIPGLPLEGYRKGLQRYGNLAVYPSKEVRDFMYYGKGGLDDEGVIIKLHYDENAASSHKYNTLSYFIHRDEVDSKVHEDVNKYLKDLYLKIISWQQERYQGSFLDKLLP